MNAIRLGIVGAGSIVEKKHLLALAEVPDLAVLALCRRDGERLGRLADRFRIAKRYTDYRELLADREIDAVLIATGPGAQPRIVLDAVAAGKPVFAEKPMAETSGEARTMAEAIREAGAHVQIGFNKRFYYGYRTAWRLIRDGDLGTPTAIHARFWFQPGRSDPLLHNGLHFLDLVQFFMGPVREAFARRSTGPGAERPDAESVAISLRFATGAVGNVLLSSLASWDYPNEHVDVVGSNQNVLSVENGRLVRVFRCGEDTPSQVYENTLSAHWWSGNGEQGFVPQFREFARALRQGPAVPGSGAGVPAAGPEDGVRALELLEAVRGSARTHDNVCLG